MRKETQKIRTFRDLHMWTKAMEIVRSVYAFTDHLPTNEQFGLTARMRRASVSLPSNIAEGFRRGSPKEFKRFLRQALGSAAELETQLELCIDLYRIDRRSADFIFGLLNHFQAMITKYIKGKPS